MARAEAISAIGMTEPGAGSDLAGIRTRAVPQGQGWRNNGQKIFISNGQLADLVLLAAKTDPDQGAKGVSLLLVDTQTPGFSRGRRLEKPSMHAQGTIKLFFTDVDVGPDALLGPPGSGFKAMMKELPQERLLVVIAAVAAMESAVQWTRNPVAPPASGLRCNVFRQFVRKPIEATHLKRQPYTLPFPMVTIR